MPVNKADFYTVLGVKSDATAKDIKTAYKKLASKHHPDKASGNEAKFKEIQEAYDTLGDAKKKGLYDNRQRGGWHSTTNDFDMDSFYRAKARAQANHNPYQSAGGAFSADDLRDMFSTRGERREEIPKIHISLKQAYDGCHVPSKHGSVHIPKGTRSKTKFCIGKDRKIVEIIVDHHNKFRRSLDDLLLTVEIDVRDVLVGNRIRFTHLDGNTYEVRIQPGTQPDQVVRLGGKGMKNPENDRYGDLLVEYKITIPVLTQTEKDAIIAIHKPRTIEV